MFEGLNLDTSRSYAADDIFSGLSFGEAAAVHAPKSTMPLPLGGNSEVKPTESLEGISRCVVDSLLLFPFL